MDAANNPSATPRTRPQLRVPKEEPAPALPSLSPTLLDLILAMLACLPTDSTTAPVPLVTLINVLPARTVPTAFCVTVARASSLPHLCSVDAAFDQLALPRYNGVRPSLQLLLPALVQANDSGEPKGMLRRLVHAACRTGNMAILRWLTKTRAIPRIFRCRDALDEAAKRNQVSVLEWWIHNICDCNGHTSLSETALVAAASHGHFDVIQWAARTHLCDDFISLRIVAACAANGHMHILNWFASVADLDAIKFGANEWIAVCRSGQLKALEWAVHDRGMPLPSNLQPCVDAAAGSGHVPVLDFLLDHTSLGAFRYSVDALDVASRNGHVAVLDWFSRACLELKCTPKALEEARNRGNVAIVQWWLSSRWFQALQKGVLPAHSSMFRVPTDNVMLAAFGCSSSIKMVRPTARHRQDVFAAAFRHGHLNVLLAFQAEFNKISDRVWLHCEAVRGNAVAILRWCATHDSQWDPYHATLGAAMVDAASAGHVAVLQFMFALDGGRRHHLVHSQLLENCMLAACQNGHVSVLELMRSHKANRDQFLYEIVTICHTLLTSAAVHGHIHVLSWWECNRLPFPTSAARIIDQVSQADGDHWLVLDWWANKQPKSFSFSELALYGAVSAKNPHSVRWWLRSGFLRWPSARAILAEADAGLQRSV